MKKLSSIVLALLLAVFFATGAVAGINDRFSDIDLTQDNYISFPEITVAPSTPYTGWSKIYVLGNDIYFLDDLGVTTSMIAAAGGGVNNLDEAYDGGGAGAGAEIAVDSGPVLFTGTHGGDNTVEATATGTGNVFDITNAGTGMDIDGTSSTWSFSKLGALVVVTIDGFTGIGDIDIDDGVTDSPALTFTDATAETAAFIKTDAGVLGLTTDATDGLNVLVGNLFVGDGAAGTAAMDGEDAYIEGELEVDGACEFDGAVNIDGALSIDAAITLANGLTIDNATNNTLEWNENSEEIKWTFADNALDLDSTSGVVTLELFDGSTGTITHAADGADDDFTLSATGAQDYSLILASAGTAADALQITTTAGGIDITNGGASGEDLDIDGVLSAVTINSDEAEADAISISATGGGIDIAATAGDIDIGTQSTYDVNILATDGLISIAGQEAVADQVAISAAGAVAGNAISVSATNGGIILNADGANGDIDIDGAVSVDIISAAAIKLDGGGTVQIDSSDWDVSVTGAVTGLASVGFDSTTVIYYDTVELSNADIKALRATKQELVATPGAGYFVEVVSVTLILDYGTNVLSESGDDLVVEYATSGDDITAAIEMTGFIDQTADTVMIVGPTNPLAANAAADMASNAVQLFNTGTDEFGGNAGADTTMTVKIAYRIHATGL